MRQDAAWRELGIEPTADLRAIKVAYARRLKTIDVEADPDAFVALREAYERAQQLAAWVDEDPDAEDVSDSVEVVASGGLGQGFADVHGEDRWEDAPAEPAGAREGAARPSPWRDTSVEKAEEHGRALFTLLHELSDPESAWAGSDKSALMLEHWFGVTDDPRMEEVSFFADAERWAANLVARTSPVSDPVVANVVHFFRWNSAEESVHQDPAIAFVIARWEALGFIEGVSKPGHALHRAWRELTRPADERNSLGWVSHRKVARLLQAVRLDYPSVEASFDWHRLEKWEKRLQRGRPVLRGLQTLGWMVAIIVIIIAIGWSVPDRDRSDGSTSPPILVTTPSLTDAPHDIEEALTAVLEHPVKVEEIERRNPKLHRALFGGWEAARSDHVSTESYHFDVRTLVENWYRDGVRNGTPALLAESQRLNLAMAEVLRRQDAARCAEFLGNGHRWPQQGFPSPPPDLIKRELALKLRALLETDGEAPANLPKRAPIPGALYARALERSGLTEARFEKGLAYKGSPADNCAARLSLLHEALKQPPKNRALLRIL